MGPWVITNLKMSELPDSEYGYQWRGDQLTGVCFMPRKHNRYKCPAAKATTHCKTSRNKELPSCNVNAQDMVVRYASLYVPCKKFAGQQKLCYQYNHQRQVSPGIKCIP